MPNKKLFTLTLGFFIVAVGLLTYIVCLPNEVIAKKDHAIKSEYKLSVPKSENLTPAPALTSLPGQKIEPQKKGEADPIFEILSNESLNSSEAVTQFLQLLPKLDAERQSEVAYHIANLSDDTVCATWSKMVASNSLPRPAAEVLFNDLLGRPHELLMPVLGAIADQPAHPLCKDSTDVLDTLFGRPPQGTRWSDWVKCAPKEP